MKHFINLKDIPAKDLRKIIVDAQKRKRLRKISHLVLPTSTRLLIILSYLLQIKVETLFLGLQLALKVLKDLVNQHPMLLRLLPMMREQKLLNKV